MESIRIYALFLLLLCKSEIKSYKSALKNHLMAEPGGQSGVGSVFPSSVVI